MIYLTSPPGPEWWAALAGAGMGLMRTPKAGNCAEQVAAFPHWAADNGCFTLGDRFDLGVYLAWLDLLAPCRGNCLFAVAPDVVGDARATWARSAPVLPELRRRGYRAALVAQDGIDPAALDWDAFDALFVGGTTRFKLAESTYTLAAEARRRGKHTHMGRVNGRPRLLAALAGGYHSADGTTMAYNPRRYAPEVLRWLREIRHQPALPLAADRSTCDKAVCEKGTMC